MGPLLSCITCISTLALRVSLPPLQREREAVKGDTTMVYSGQSDCWTNNGSYNLHNGHSSRRGDLVSQTTTTLSSLSVCRQVQAMNRTSRQTLGWIRDERTDSDAIGQDQL